MTALTLAPTEPYVGPRPFEKQERHLFFGRDREAHDIASLVLANRFFLLYAASGAGKTSLVNAGVRPLVEDELEVLPTARFQISAAPGLVTAPNVYVDAVLSAWADPQRGSPPGPPTLAEFLRQRPRTADYSGQPMPRLLVFDQFEELFTTHPERWPERRAFLEQLAEATDTHADLRVLVILREDFLPHMLDFANTLDGGLRDRYHLEALRRPAAELAITGPVQTTGRSFMPAAVDNLVSKLMANRVNLGNSRVTQVTGEFVQPVLLQVVCRTLWDALPPEASEISAADVSRLADVDQALARFYADAVKTAAARSGVAEPMIRTWFEQNLITVGGTRGTMYVGEKTTGGLPNEAVSLLEGTLLQAEFRAGAKWLEITHDSLLAPIEQANREFAARARGPSLVRRLRAGLGQRLREALSRLFQAWILALGCGLVAGNLAGNQSAFLAGAGSLLAVLTALIFAWGLAAAMMVLLRGRPRTTGSPDDLADQLAAVLARQWETEGRGRGESRPLRLSWQAMTDWSEPWADIERTALEARAVGGALAAGPAGWAAAPDDFAGSGDVIRDVFDRVPTGRLIVLGEPGSGKTVLLRRLVQGLLARRGLGETVPVLLPLASWDPRREKLHDWALRRLATDYPFLQAADLDLGEDTSPGSALLENRKLLLVLDGLDEVAAAARPLAIRRINSALRDGEGLILACRAGEYGQAALPGPSGVAAVLQGALCIRLKPPSRREVAAYLTRGADGARRWQPVLAALDTTAPVALALNTPLTVVLADAVYNPRPTERTAEPPDPAELLAFPTVPSLTEHLFGAFIRTAYPSGPGPDEGRWARRWTRRRISEASARRWLAFLARHAGLAW